MKLLLIAFLTTVWLCASANMSADDTSPSRSPSPEEFIGIWWPDEKGQKQIRERSPSAAAMFELELRSDGKFAFVNIPKWWRNVFGQPSDKLGGVGGRWTLRLGASGAEIFLEVFELNMTLGTGGDEGSREILVHLGDGDQSIAVRLLRKYGELNPPR